MEGMSPEPLPNGTVLFGRYTIHSVLGRGGFGITYLGADGTMQVAIKELTPPGSRREESGSLRIEGDARGLVRAFVEEARVMRNFRHPRVLRVREAFLANETAYCVTEYRPGTRSLEVLLRERGRLPEAEVVPILRQLAEPLAALHEAGFLHRDLKPSNVLIDAAGEVTLIDFGAARSWQADTTHAHTVIFTPGYAPIEQLTENARRGPGTDLYGLCALAYVLLTGNDPPDPLQRVAQDQPLILPSSLSPALAQALESGLQVQLVARPSSVVEWLAILDGQPHPSSAWATLVRMDAAIGHARQLHPGKRECPQCSAPLAMPKPIPTGRCPVCQSGRMIPFDFDETRCPLCPVGRLKEIANVAPLVRCPKCSHGALTRQRSLPWQPSVGCCQGCEAKFSEQKGAVTDLATGEVADWAEWGQRSGRSELLRVCNHCHAEFDQTERGRWRQFSPTPEPGAFTELFADEWARVASGKDPDTGSHHCDGCHAEYYLSDGMLTLLEAGRDAYGFAAKFRGQPLNLDQVPFLAVGKISGAPGLVCGECALELDEVGTGYLVIHATQPGLRRAGGTAFSLLNLHRLARDLPTLGEEEVFAEDASELLAEALTNGETPLDPRHPDVLWRGRCAWNGASGNLSITESEITFGRGLSKSRWSTERFQSVLVTGDELTFVGEEEELTFQIEPIAVDYKMEFHTYSCELDATDLATIFENSSVPPN